MNRDKGEKSNRIKSCIDYSANTVPFAFFISGIRRHFYTLYIAHSCLGFSNGTMDYNSTL